MLSWIKVGAGILYDRRMRARVLGYRPGIICLVKSTQTDRFLFITPTEKPTAWMPPQEGIEADESPKAAAIRCLRVELGIPEEKTHFRKTVWLGCKEIPEQQGRRDVEHSVIPMRGKAYYAGLIKVDESTKVLLNPAEIGEFAWFDVAQIREHLPSNSDRKQLLLRQSFQRLCGITL